MTTIDSIVCDMIKDVKEKLNNGWRVRLYEDPFQNIVIVSMFKYTVENINGIRVPCVQEGKIYIINLQRYDRLGIRHVKVEGMDVIPKLESIKDKVVCIALYKCREENECIKQIEKINKEYCLYISVL